MAPLVKYLTLKHEDLSLESTQKNPGVGEHICNPKAKEIERGEHLGLSGQSV